MSVWLCISQVCGYSHCFRWFFFLSLFFLYLNIFGCLLAIPVSGLSVGSERALPQRTRISSVICRWAVPVSPLRSQSFSPRVPRFCATVTQNHMWQLCSHDVPGSLSFLPPPSCSVRHPGRLRQGPLWLRGWRSGLLVSPFGTEGGFLSPPCLNQPRP